MRLIGLFLLVWSCGVFSQQSDSCYAMTNNDRQLKGWSLSTGIGYINIAQPNLGNNVWGSVNLSYSKKNWNVTLWTGSNFWIEGRQPDLRIGLSTSYTILKW